MHHIPFLNIKAKDNYKLGQQLGITLRLQIQHRVNTNKKLYLSLGLPNFQILIAKAQKFLPAIQKHFPKLLSELYGLSDGAKIPFNELLVLTCEEELLNLKIPKCTSLAVRQQKHIFVGHNEDWLPSYRNNGLYIMRTTLKSRRFLSVSYLGTLPGAVCGLNSNGFCFTGNSINSKRFRYGVPKTIQLRALLDCRDLTQALHVDTTDSSISNNSLYAWSNAKICDIEDHFQHYDLFSDQSFLIHTNHPLKREDRLKSNTARESIKRYERAVKILLENKKHDENVIRMVLADHQSGICSHTKQGRGYGVTIVSTIINPEEKWIKVAWTNPCRNRYKRFDLFPEK